MTNIKSRFNNVNRRLPRDDSKDAETFKDVTRLRLPRTKRRRCRDIQSFPEKMAETRTMVQRHLEICVEQCRCSDDILKVKPFTRDDINKEEIQELL